MKVGQRSLLKVGDFFFFSLHRNYFRHFTEKLRCGSPTTLLRLAAEVWADCPSL